MADRVVHFEATGKEGGKLREFYGKVFGWSFNVMPEMDYGIVDGGGKGIGGGIGGSDPAPSGSAVFYVSVADPQATLKKAESLGGKTAMPVTEIPNVVTLAQFTDPDGNLIGIVKDDGSQPEPSGAAPLENAVTWFEIAGRDASKTRDFYGQLFGWSYNLPPDMDYGMVDAPEGGIGGGVTGGPEGDPHAIWYVEVANPEAKLNEVASHGGNVVLPATDGGMVTFGLFTDPEGNLAGVFKSNQ
jgi:predicted enzyme related to lactoylglutathione lyase